MRVFLTLLELVLFSDLLLSPYLGYGGRGKF